MFEVWRKLKIPDPECVSARQTLLRLGYPVDGHRGLEKYERFSVDAPSTVMSDAVQYLVNPNKHVYIVGRGQRMKGDTERFRKERDSRIVVVTEDDTVASDALGVLRGRYGHGNVRGVVRAVVWDVLFEDGVAQDEMRTYAERMAGELFANPNFQRYEIVM